MYEFISGKVVARNPAFVVLENEGIGYLIQISLNTFSALADNSHAKLYIHMAIREDAHVLYGFFDQNERSLFQLLITVSGVGANTARLILSSLSSSETIDAIANGKVHVLQSVKGIGGKTAQRIVVDLKDKVAKSGISSEKVEPLYNTIKTEALSGLLILGFNKNAADKVLDKLLQQNTDLSVEKLIKEALKLL